jgi:hypothetical protein
MKTFEMKIYIIEEAPDTYYKYYRFKSLYNDCIGSWINSKEKAIAQGDLHQKIIENSL